MTQHHNATQALNNVATALCNVGVVSTVRTVSAEKK
jgi:hypothetical protein